MTTAADVKTKPSSITEGEWSVTVVGGSYKQPYLIQVGDKTIAQCFGNQLEPDATSIGEARANAALIAAAPDLYAVVVEWLGVGNDMSARRAVRERARAAIAKAESRR